MEIIRYKYKYEINVYICVFFHIYTVQYDFIIHIVRLCMTLEAFRMEVWRNMVEVFGFGDMFQIRVFACFCYSDLFLVWFCSYDSDFDAALMIFMWVKIVILMCVKRVISVSFEVLYGFVWFMLFGL